MPGQPHLRCTLVGVLGSLAAPFEQWTMSYAFEPGGTLTLAARAERLADVAAQYFARSTTHVSPFARPIQFAVAQMDANHRQVGETLRLAVNTQGGGQNRTVPSQVALRVSLGSGLRGRSQKGGFYLPVPDCQMSTADGQIPQQDATDVLGSTITWIDGSATLGEGTVVVASSVAGNVPVRQVRIGRRLDVIRRRANGIPEGYVGQSF